MWVRDSDHGMVAITRPPLGKGMFVCQSHRRGAVQSVVAADEVSDAPVLGGQSLASAPPTTHTINPGHSGQQQHTMTTATTMVADTATSILAADTTGFEHQETFVEHQVLENGLFMS